MIYVLKLVCVAMTPPALSQGVGVEHEVGKPTVLMGSI